MERTAVVAFAEGLHARPAALFVKEAAARPVTVGIARPGGEPVAAASILAVLTLGVGAGEEVVLSTTEDGADAAASLDALVSFLERGAVA